MLIIFARGPILRDVSIKVGWPETKFDAYSLNYKQFKFLLDEVKVK